MTWSPEPGVGGPPAAGWSGRTLLRRSASLVAHSVRRHKAVVAGLWLGIVALTLGLTAVLPKTYAVHTVVQVKPGEGIPALASRANPVEGDAATRQATKAVLGHASLVALVRQTDLVRKWTLHRAPVLQLKDALWPLLFHVPTEEERVEALVGYLEDRLKVTTGEDLVTIGIHFPDPELAYDLVERARQNFIDARQAAAIASIADTASILETRATQARDALEESRSQLQKLRDARTPKPARGAPVRSTKRPAPVPDRQPDEETSQLLALVQNKRRTLADQEETQRRRLAQLEARLEEQRALYSENHPAVRDLRQGLEAVRQESPQQIALRQELANLEATLRERGFLVDTPLRSARTGANAVEAVALELDDNREGPDAEIEYAKTQLRNALARYRDLLDRVASTRLEQDTAQAAFKYRYAVIWPAQRPRGPIAPDPASTIPASVIAGLVVGILGAVLVDVYSRKVLEPWQVEQGIGVPLIGELRVL